MASSEPFTFVETTKEITKEGFESYVDILSAKVADVDIQFSSRLRSEYPEMILTTIPRSNIDLILFADLGYAFCEIDIKSDTVSRWRGYIPPDVKGNPGFLGEIINYARYKYKFGDEYFILYYVKFGYTALQYVLKEPRAGGETPNTTSSFTDKLIKAAGDVLYKQSKGIYVFDGYWYKDKKLYDQVQDSTWDKVILDENMKKDLTEVSEKFFDSKDIYDDLGVPWKRGIMFHGPPGNGKTISIKALMRTLAQRSTPIPTLYVKSARGTYSIRSVFQFARTMSPCMLVLEDIETIVYNDTRSYFFNEVDGLENNDGILMVASTNFLERLDPGLTKRPSRFDRKYLFPLPNEHERVLYAQFWHDKLKNKSSVEFPKKLCEPIARITNDFSFAYIQEAIFATLLDLARRRTDDIAHMVSELRFSDDDKDDLDKYIFWRVFKQQVKILRDDMDSKQEEFRYLAPSMHASQSLEPLQTSMPTLPGTFRDENHMDMGTSQMGFEQLPMGLDKDTRARLALSRYEKRIYVNSAANELRPLGGELPWTKRS